MTDPFPLSIAQTFSAFPAGRHRRDGRFTGQAFRDDVLIPELKRHGKVRLVLDGVAGLPSSFLEEVFGGLIREKFANMADLEGRLEVQTSESELKVYIPLAWRYAREAATHLA